MEVKTNQPKGIAIMTEFDNRKHARQPRGYNAVYGQNGITYQPAAIPERKQKSCTVGCLPLILAVIVIIVLALVLAHFAGVLTLWEDGSFRLFNLTGCLPGGICS